ncbi:MAG: bifunctional 3,4-dihydroxy-2-butanone-4-phosphate synthase/GTP cyclohydrolase II [Burkholderiaceae bacterium]
MSLATVHQIIEELRNGRMVVLVDEEDRENEGDLVLAADFVTPEAINFMARYARGLICLTLTEQRCQALRLPLMVQTSGSAYGTNFTLSIEAAAGVTTGISAADRAHTIAVAVAADTRPEDIVQPGHIFPVMAQPGGVLARAGHTEAGCDLAALAGLTPAAVICEVLKEDGTMARLPDLLEFAAEHGLKTGAIVDLIEYRSAHESLVSRHLDKPIETQWGVFRLVSYVDQPGGNVHMALVHGEIKPDHEVLVRVHEPLTPLDLLVADGGTHSWPVARALQKIAASPSGVMVMLNCAQSGEHLHQQLERFGSGPGAKTEPEAAVKFDLRTYGVGAQILRDLGVAKMRVLSAPRKMPSMAGFGLEVTGFEEV